MIYLDADLVTREIICTAIPGAEYTVRYDTAVLLSSSRDSPAALVNGRPQLAGESQMGVQNL